MREPTSRLTRLEDSDPGSEPNEGAPPEIQEIGRFSVLRKLGEGGMGVVYAAHDEELDRDVAIKLLKSPDQSRPARARMLREARAMAKLSHPNVITIYDVGTIDDQIFIAMEFVRGATLKRWTKARPRTWRGILERFVEAGRGLAAAHGAGLIHRDFKPDNVLVGEDGRVRVLDFGLARPVDLDEDDPSSLPRRAPAGPDDETADRLTFTGAVMGTPAYMSPEQWCGRDIDHATDQFSFCVALWEALFGERPFGGATAHSIASKVLAGELGSPPEDRAVPAWLLRVLRRGLSTETQDRFESMDELLFVLSRLQSERGEPAPRMLDAPAAGASLFAQRYEVPDVPAAGATTVAKDRLTGRRVAIRCLHRSAPERVRTLVGLRHPNLAATVDYGERDADAWIATEFFDGAADVVQWGRDQPESIRANLVAQLLRVVGYLHERGLVHRGLSPRTVRVVHGQIKLTDPVPIILGEMDSDLTASYAAPEVLLRERSDAASDLYSIGILAHELFTGRRPHQAAAPGDVVDEAITSSPSLDGHDLEPAVAAVILRLLQPRPSMRYESAAHALRAFISATGVPLTAETVETRESVLRTAPFTGRDAELGHLVQALRRCSDGNGEVWLLGGESGVGKSRLLEELEAEAVSRGALVVRGQAKAEAERPYEVWRRLFALLAMDTTDELAAGVFATLVPDIARLRGRDVLPALGLDAKSTKVRLHNAVLQSLRAFPRPVLVLLEDLHWSGSESVELLQRLVTTLGGLRVMLVASYRDDEAPDLPGRVDGARSLVLRRLDAAAVSSLAASMTGSVAPKLAALLERETEGNAFFLVEVVRLLAEEAGALRDIDAMELPATVVSGGVRRVLRRRVDRVDTWARPLLEAVAVAGRFIDIELTRELADGVEVERFTRHCADCAVLEGDATGWRFRHDKLREYVLSELPDARRVVLHRDVLHALQRLHGDGGPTQALAHHAAQAGDLAEEARYCGTAGEQALRNGAYDDAVTLLQRAIEIREHGVSTRRDVMRWYRMLGEAHYVLGDLSRAVETLAGTLAELGRPLPSSRPGWAVLLLRLVFVQTMLLVLPGRFVARKAERRDELREASKAAGRIANLSTYSGDQVRIIANSLLSANLAERAAEASAYSLAVMGYAASYMGLRRLAERYFGRASAAAREQGDPIAYTEATQMECAYRIGGAELERVKQVLDSGYAASERAGFQLGLALSEGFTGQCEYLAGNFEAMLAHYGRARELLTLRSPEHEHSFLCGEALALCMLGRFAEADALLTDAVDRVGAEYLLGEAFVLSSRAFVHAWSGDVTQALRAARAANDYVHAHGIAVPGPCGYVIDGPLEALLCAAAQDRDVLPAARTQVQMMSRWARKHPVGEASAQLARARLAVLDGREDVAAAAAAAALGAAKRLGLRFVEGQAALALGSLDHGDARTARGHLQRAGDLFRRCGAAHHQALALRALDVQVGSGAAGSAVDESSDDGLGSAESDGDAA